MTNYEIADRFTRIADILEIQGENPFKVRAYRNAAETINDLEDSLEEIEARGKLAELPGFGAGVLGITRDFLTKGTTPIWETLSEQVPEGVVQIARVPGIGPKTVKTLWESLKVNSVAELLTAAQEGKVRVLPGFGAAKESKLIENIEKWYRLNERTPRYIALTQADRLARQLAQHPAVERVEVAGELRRGMDTVSEVTLAVATGDIPAVARALQSLPGLTCEEEIPEGSRGIADPRFKDLDIVPAKLFCHLGSGLKVTVYLSPRRLFGWAMLDAIGPEAFAEKHRRICIAAKEEEWADMEAEDAEMAARVAEWATSHYSENPRNYTEPEDVFQPLEKYGAYVEPELRDWPDAAEREMNFEFLRLITEADFRGQLHEHSTYSDGVATIREMAEAAMARGYEYLAITDHSRSLTIANGLHRDRHLRQLDEIAALNAEYAGRFTLLAGIEADVLQDGSLDCDDDILERLDVVVGSVHIRYKEDEAGMTKRICTALSNPYLTLLGHPTGRLLGRREPYPVDMAAVIECAARYRKALEINASPDRMDLKDTYARQAAEAGVKITINADAHSPAGLGMLPWGLCMARRAGLTPEDVINTYSLARLRREVLRKK